MTLPRLFPALATWATLAAPAALSPIAPAAVAIGVILFDLYWLFKVLVMGAHLTSGWLHYETEREIPWPRLLRQLRQPRRLLKTLHDLRRRGHFLQRRLIIRDTRSLIARLAEDDLPDPRCLIQAVILPSFREPLEVIEKTLTAIVRAKWPLRQTVVILAFEEREGAPAREKAAFLLRRFRGRFRLLLASFHPHGLPGEIPGKGGNVTYATKKLAAWARREKIPPEEIIVSTFDADARPHRNYFAALAWRFTLEPDRHRRTFQPIPVYANNIWRVSPFSRIVAFSNSFWQLIEATRPHRMVNFSAQAQSLRFLLDCNLWDTSTIVEDSRQYYRAFFRFGGNHAVVPFFTPVFMDAVEGRTGWETFRLQYRQRRRWAWGAEHLDYIVSQWRRHPEIPWWRKTILAARLIEGHWSWANAALLIALAAWFPLLASPEFRLTLLGANLPIFASRLLSLTWFGIAVSVFLSLQLLPPRPVGANFLKQVGVAASWLLLPITTIIFGSLPAIDAQTRIALGQRLPFHVTPKAAVPMEAQRELSYT